MDNTMKTHSLNAPSAAMPLHTHWDSQQLADAVPLRLSQLLDFSADTLRACERACANAEALRGTKRSTTFLPPASLTPFRTR
jgi:hypothetical protein